MLLFLDISGGELALIVLFIFIVLGPDKLPEIARKFGKMMRFIRKATDDIKREINIDEDLIADRVVTNVIHTALGLKMTRKVYAFSQQYNDNYFIYEYTFENTGNIDDDDQIELSETIHDFYFGMMSRYCTSREAREVTNLRQAGWGAHQWVYHTPMSVPVGTLAMACPVKGMINRLGLV